MSDFACPSCGVINQDSPRGYIAACHHNPPHNRRTVILRFDESGERDCEGFYDGAFYRSESGYAQRLAVHPVRWFDRGVVSSPLDSVDHGPQKQPASLAKVKAETRRVRGDLDQ